CPAAVAGDRTLSSLAVCTDPSYADEGECTGNGETWIPAQTWLKAATELFDDGIGDDDGLCESNEACLYAPNFGAYQGHGIAWGQTDFPTCEFDANDGPITGVTMAGYPSNGRPRSDTVPPETIASFEVVEPWTADYTSND